MKGKTEVLILVAIIAIAAVYLATRTTNRENFEIPALASVAADTIDRVEIAGPKATLTLSRTTTGWQVTPGDLPVDTHKMDGILETIAELTVTDLVSQAKSYDRYDLGTDRQIAVSAWAGDRNVREFSLGKSAPTFAHTYVRMADNPVIYQARGDFRRKFDRDPESLRDKIILKFEPDDVAKVELTGLTTDTLTITQSKPDSGNETPSAEKAATSSAAGWSTSRGNVPPPAEADRLLLVLHRLECRQFLSSPPVGAPMIQVVVDVGNAPVALDIFPKADAKAEVYPARSSQNDSAFTLPEGIVTMLRTLALKVFEVAPSELKVDSPSPDTTPSS